VEIDFSSGTQILKALSSETRIRIVHILSCNEMCGCDIQKFFDLTQPTMSHHLEVLTESGLVSARRAGKWIYYRINSETAVFLRKFLESVLSPGDECFCKIVQDSISPPGTCVD
jgi:ArsR family transcriptional regulator